MNDFLILLAYLGIGLVFSLLAMKYKIKRGVTRYDNFYYLIFFAWPLTIPTLTVLEIYENYNFLEIIFYKLVRNSN